MQPTAHDASLETIALTVPPDYIDLNGHMNIGYYSVLFDEALIRPYYQGVGVGREMIDRDQKTTFALESHFTYQKEVMAGDLLRFGFRILDLDPKRAHLFLTMTRTIDGSLAATHETISMCVDIRSRRGTEWPEWVMSRPHAVRDSRKDCPLPAEAGQRIGIRRR